MAKRKLKSFAELETFPNVFQLLFKNEDFDFELKGKWNQTYFKNSNPIVLELGCGKGEYTIGMAEKYPEKNFIGIDLKGARIWRGAKTAITQDMKNVAFIRTQVERIYNFFAPAEISEIWITFPDPQPQKTRTRKRLTSPIFLAHYKKVLTSNGIVHLKTDNQGFFEYTLETTIQEGIKTNISTFDIQKDYPENELLAITTHYESIYRKLGVPIKYLNFNL